MRILILMMLSALTMAARASVPADTLRKQVMRRIFAYPSTIDTTGLSGTAFYAYTKYMFRTNHRNALLMLVPDMYAITRDDEREFFSEQYSKITLLGGNDYQQDCIVDITTMPRRRKAMQHVMRYTTPSIYDPTLFGGNILSPFHKDNRVYYRYRVEPQPFGRTEVKFVPVNDNTQLVEGVATVETLTGKILHTELLGEYDMVRYHLEAKMGNDGIYSLFPKECDLDFSFSLLKNKLSGRYRARFDQEALLPDTIRDSGDTTLMNMVRPEALDWIEQQTVSRYLEKRQHNDSIRQDKPKKKNFAKDVLWDMIGENLLEDIRGNFGENKQGNLRIKPILNPLYMGYSKRKGFYYKFDARGGYIFNSDWQVSLRLKAGYIFRFRQLYYRIPATINFNKEHNGYIRIEIGNGNRITNSRVLDAIKQQHRDSINWEGMDLEYFKDYNYNIFVHYDLSSKIGFEAGFNYHRRAAVNKQAHIDAGQTSTYRSAAPTLRLIYRPRGYGGVIISADYERSFSGLMSSNMSYERFEFDAQHIWRMKRLNALKIRLGAGFYTSKSRGEYFLDYTNFRDNNIPGGWEDDWTGDFELLNSNWYNASKYYLRSNLTYETPILCVAWLPLVGRFIERERIYVNTLCVEKLNPYAEWGYGFTTRLFSAVGFVAFNHRKFEGFGVKLGFELFRNW